MGEFFFFNQGIKGEKDFALPGMSITDHALQLIAIDVFGLGSRREFLETDINRISTEFHGSEKSFEATCGRKQLDFLWCVDVRHFYLLDRKKKPGKTPANQILVHFSMRLCEQASSRSLNFSPKPHNLATLETHPALKHNICDTMNPLIFSHFPLMTF